MDTNILKSLLSRLNRYAFESFIIELESIREDSEPFLPLTEAGEGVYYQPIRDSYGGSLHSLFLLHYTPLELFPNFDAKLVCDPVITQSLKNIRKLYKGKVGYWGMVAPEIRKAEKLQSIGFLTNLYNVDQSTYQNKLLPEYTELAQNLGLKKALVLVGSYDSFIEFTPEQTEQAFINFIKKNHDGLCISIGEQQMKVDSFSTERNLTGGVFQNTKYPYEPVYLGEFRKENLLSEFASLINSETLESELEDFLVAHYKDIFGSKYDQIETQLWLRFPELDISGGERRLDVFLRNSVINDWELFEIKRVLNLSGTYRDAPVLAIEITYAIQQIKNYSRILLQDVVKRHFAKQGIEYYEPTLNIVVGRTPQISHEQWRWLITNDRDVNILTYDNLLNEMKLRVRERHEALYQTPKKIFSK